jgi:hypothetical protein
MTTDMMLDFIRSLDPRDRSRFIATIAREMLTDMDVGHLHAESQGLHLPWIQRPDKMCFVFATGRIAEKLDAAWKVIEAEERKTSLVVGEVTFERNGR